LDDENAVELQLLDCRAARIVVVRRATEAEVRVDERGLEIRLKHGDRLAPGRRAAREQVLPRVQYFGWERDDAVRDPEVPLAHQRPEKRRVGGKRSRVTRRLAGARVGLACERAELLACGIEQPRHACPGCVEVDHRRGRPTHEPGGTSSTRSPSPARHSDTASSSPVSSTATSRGTYPACSVRSVFQIAIAFGSNSLSGSATSASRAPGSKDASATASGRKETPATGTTRMRSSSQRTISPVAASRRW